MAKKQRSKQITTAFHYLVKSMHNEDDPENPLEAGFSEAEFGLVLQRLRDTNPIDDRDEDVVARIKSGLDLPFLEFDELAPGVYFGDFEGAYYGQKFRNNQVGEIDPDSLNMRRFHYLITRLRDGKILIGVSYHGAYGDYEGFKSCVSHRLRGNYQVASKTLKSVRGEIGEGQPVSMKLTYRKAPNRVERRPLFGSSGEIAIKRSDFGENFEERVNSAAQRLRGPEQNKKRILADLVSQGELLELDEEEIIGCSALIRENGRYRTVYFLGENNFATKFPLRVDVGVHGQVNRDRVGQEMLRVMREEITPLLHEADAA